MKKPGLKFAAIAIGIVALLWFGACNQILAVVMPSAGVHAIAPSCPLHLVAVGDSLKFTGLVTTASSRSGMQGPLDDWTLADSRSRPRAFRWSVSDAGKADITRDGILIGRAAGIVSVTAHSAFKQSSSVSIKVIPRVTQFAVYPRDTTVRVGDTIRVRADAELAGPTSGTELFIWDPSPGGPFPHMLERVQQDPDHRVSLDVREQPAVALQAGTAYLTACFAGTRVDTAIIRISREPRPVNRDVPPTLRLTPLDTNVYAGDDLSAYVRILNASLNNGPYHVVTTTGNDAVFRDSTARGSTAPFGIRRDLFHEHSYLTPGSYPLTVTVTDSAGRSTTARTIVTVSNREFETKVLLPEGEGAVRLSGESPDIAIALIARKAKALWPSHVMGGYADIPPIQFGRTVFDKEQDGRRRAERDVNGDGENDSVFYVDKATLRRNGDLRLGRNRLVVTGVVNRPRHVMPGVPESPPFFPPIRAVAEFDVIP